MDTITLILATVLVTMTKQKIDNASTDSEKKMHKHDLILWTLVFSTKMLTMGAQASGNQFLYDFFLNGTLAVNMYLIANFLTAMT